MYRNVYTDNLNIIKEAALLGSDKSNTVTVQDIQDLFEYSNGNRTENIIGKKITILCPDGKSLTVKLLNEVKDLDKLKIGMRIQLINLTGKIYSDNHGRLALSSRAEGWSEANV